MLKLPKPWIPLGLLAGISMLPGVSLYAQVKDVTQPGDPIVASSSNSPGSEAVANAIDGQPTKYLNFDTRTGGKPSGFEVSPSIGRTVVTGITLQSANDAPERDAKHVLLEGSNDATLPADYTSGTWETVADIDNIPSWATTFPGNDRFQTQEFFFSNIKPFRHYRFTVLATQTENGCCFQVAEVELLGVAAPKDVTQPGDPIIASSSNSPGSEAVANAIDGQPTKYLNFDTRTGGKPSGFEVSPSIGRTLVTGITLQSANDAPERDAKHILLEGSNDAALPGDYTSGTWETVADIDNIPSWATTFPGNDRFQTQEFFFANLKPFRHYRFTVLATQTENGCCFQVAEVELLGTAAPKDVTQPGDTIVASSSNSPGSEAVANAIDGQPTKYLNFDTRTGGKPSGFEVTPSIGRTVVTGLTLQSANDAPERDAKHVLLEGSNDATLPADYTGGTWETVADIDNIPSWATTFPGNDRFQTQEFYFANIKPYRHYRLTVLATQTENGCCFQVAEVELLAVTAQADCTKARFVAQPSDTPVLEGSSATFSVTLNGPWPLQWLKNGKVISGATSTTYTTDPITALNATDTYAAQIVGCEISTPVHAVLFTPSATKSIGINFQGGGANGTPTRMFPTDIAGLQPQAHWNNIKDASGSVTGDNTTKLVDSAGAVLAEPLSDSDGNASDISFTFSSSGTWGAGTGSGSASQRMLNGLLEARPGSTAKLIFGNVPTGSHSVIAYFVGIPLQFQDGDYTITGATTETIYVRVINADEYNPAPGFFRGTSTDPLNRTLATFVRFDNVSPDADGVITLSWTTPTTGFDRGVPVNGVQLVLNAPDAGSPPTITQNPQPTVAAAGGTVRLSAGASGSGLTYQWRKNGKNVPNGGNVFGATSSTLTISPVGADDVGLYSVAVFNAAGSALSKNASVRLSKFDIKENLVTYLPFNETEGAKAANAASGGLPGTVVGTPTWSAGKVGGALGFDGSSTYVQIDTYPKAGRQLSGSAWVNLADGLTTDVALFRNAQKALGLGAGVGPGTPAGQFEVRLAYDTTLNAHVLRAVIGAGPNLYRAIAPGTFTAGSWQHVAFSADGAQLRLYVNGQEVTATDYGSAINPPDIQYLSIGAQLTSTLVDPNDPSQGSVIAPDVAPAYLSGQLDELALWNRGLTGDEVALIYAAGNAAKALTTVVPIPPKVPGKLGIAIGANSAVTVSWDQGTLQTATSITGPWVDVAGKSPFTDTAANGTVKFYRTVVQ